MRVIIESPYAGNIEENLQYLHDCVQDCLRRGEAPFASHGFYTQFLDDADPEQRKAGMDAGFEWMEACDKVVVYSDKGISDGMEAGMAMADSLGKPVEVRSVHTLPYIHGRARR